MPGWGEQLPVDRVLTEMRSVGLTSTELGAIGWLPTDPTELKTVLAAHDVRVVGAFVPLTCHDPARRERTLAEAEEMAALLQDIGAENFVTAVVNDPEDWSRPELSEEQWAHLFSMLDEIEGVTTAHGVRQVVHPHADTLIQTAEEVERFLQSSSSAMCLDTGHLAVGGADPVAIADRYASRIGLVHLKDVRTAVADRYNAGELPWMAAVQAGLFATVGRRRRPGRGDHHLSRASGLRRPVRARAGRGHHRRGAPARRRPRAERGEERRVPAVTRRIPRRYGPPGGTRWRGRLITNHRPREPDINHLRGNHP